MELKNLNQNNMDIMDDEIPIEFYDSMTRMAFECRARAIDSAALIELQISRIFIDMFSNEKTKKSLEKYLFSDALTFEAKISLFCSLNKSGALKEKDVSINKDLNDIKNIRNYMAHSNVLINKETKEAYNKRQLTFVSFTTRGQKEITFKFFDINDDADGLIFSINAIITRRNRIFTFLDKLI